ncbi:hypothetical protein J6590_084522 [Homalodisca vitripennis]|nr:hypothetical protein J6590_084522 [Homalodisca vitripennis]
MNEVNNDLVALACNSEQREYSKLVLYIVFVTWWLYGNTKSPASLGLHSLASLCFHPAFVTWYCCR